MAERMNNDEYLATQEQVLLHAKLLLDVPLEGFLTRISSAEAVAPFMDPTLYRDVLFSGNLDMIRDVAGALREAQKKIQVVKDEWEARQPKPEPEKRFVLEEISLTEHGWKMGGHYEVTPESPGEICDLLDQED